MPETESLKLLIVEAVLEKVDQDADRRAEALSEYITLTAGVDQEKALTVAGLVPPIQNRLYRRWVRMFADRLLETVPRDQIEHLTGGEEENKAALALAYLMFLESERMEAQVQKDIAEYGLEHTHDPDMGRAAAEYIRSSMSELAAKLNKKPGH